MRRTLLLLATIMFALVVAGGVALAATVTCTGDPECVGTDENDRIKGSNNDEHIFGFGGSDIIDGNGGSDHVVGDRSALGEPTTTPDGDDKLDGGPDADRIYGFGGSDTLIGSQGGTTSMPYPANPPPPGLATPSGLGSGTMRLAPTTEFLTASIAALAPTPPRSTSTTWTM